MDIHIVFGSLLGISCYHLNSIFSEPLGLRVVTGMEKRQGEKNQKRGKKVLEKGYAKASTLNSKSRVITFIFS